MQPHQVAKMVKFFRGIYRRIALRFDVDESYVHRIANGDRHNLRIQKALDREWVKAQRLLAEPGGGLQLEKVRGKLAICGRQRDRYSPNSIASFPS